MAYKLSVIIPAYNEQERIGPTLDGLANYFEGKDYSFEIVVVNDGSADNTVEVAKSKQQILPSLRIIENDRNRGKGYTVKHGVSEARGDYVLFFDADSSTPIEEVDKFWPLFEQGYGVCIGSRALPESDIVIHQPWYREAMGRTFNLLVRLIAVRGVKDTQCGFKAFSAEAAKTVFKRQTLDGFGFDVELLFIARKFGFKIAEVPIKWINSPDSKVSTAGGAKAFSDLLVIRYKNFKGAYK